MADEATPIKPENKPVPPPPPKPDPVEDKFRITESDRTPQRQADLDD